MPAAIVVASTLGGGVASASPNYAPALQSFFGLAEAPSCALCHTTDEGGPARINSYVGTYFKSRLGLEAGLSDDAFKDVAFRWNAYQDSDGDGAFDTAEVRAYSDPNDANVLPGSPKSVSPEPIVVDIGDDDDDDDDDDALGRRGASLKASDGGCSYAGPANPGGSAGAALFAAGLLGLSLRRRRPRGA